MSSRYAVVTGGTGGIGRALLNELSSNSWEVEAPGTRDLDLRDPAAIRSYFMERKPDLLVCAAGITRDAIMARSSEEDWDETWSVNFTGAALCATAVIPSMVTRKYGHIVLLSSWSALHPPVGQAAYAASKAALLGLAHDLAQTYGTSNIRINTILPGFLETRMTSVLGAERREQILDDHVLRRFNTCDRVASFIRYLHEQLPHTSGQIFQLDSRIV